MEEKKYEFVLGVSDLGGFEILEHTLNPRPHEFDAGLMFYVNDWSMGDGDGHPARYDSNLYKTIPKSVYEKTMKLFRKPVIRWMNLQMVQKNLTEIYK